MIRCGRCGANFTRKINGIGTKNVTVKANAASLTAGTYGGLMCVNTNDLAHPQFEIPVTFTVTPNIANDTIFKNGFDGAPPVDPDVVTGTINLPVQADGDGSTLDFVTGLYGTYDPARVDDVNLYDYGDGTLTVYWYGDASALSVGGVVDGGGAEFAVLHSGDVIGPSSTILATSKKLANWTTGADGYLGVGYSLDLGYRRVEWKCDALNLRSRRAAQRMGFTFEGIQEAHYIVKGRNRDTAWFRILDREWPGVRAKLEGLLATSAG